MYVIREVLNCRPGKVRDMVGKFRNISLGGVGRDAEHIVHHIVSTRPAGRR